MIFKLKPFSLITEVPPLKKIITPIKSYFTSPLTGQTLFTRSWLPLSPPRGIICMVHGYANDISWTFQSNPPLSSLPKLGFPVLPLIYQAMLNLMASKLLSQILMKPLMLVFLSALQSLNPHNSRICLFFLYGAILIAPMCKISDKIRPKWPIPDILTLVGKFMPILPIVTTPNILDKSVKVPEKKAIAVMNPLRYNGKPRLGTVIELLRVTDYMSGRLNDVRIPFIALHGSSDCVTDPNVSRVLYQEAKSEDKSIKIYDGMFHFLLFGETDENVELVRKDILGWLNDICKGEVQ